jgi:hypothetical protein
MHSDPIIRRTHACAVARVPVCYWGGPGTGKTARAFAYAKARKLHVERWLLSRCEPIDLKPRIYEGGRVIVADPPEIVRLAEHNGGLLFLDELNRAARETEGAALDRIDYPPPGVFIIAACNPPSKGQAARSLESAAANRFCHLDVVANAEAWANAQVSGWPEDEGESALPWPDEATMARADARARALASAYIRKAGGTPADAQHPDHGTILEELPSNTVHAGRAWGSTRTWEYARRVHAAAIALSLDAEDTRTLIAGCIGDGAAIHFLAYVADADLPDPEELLKDPDKYVPPANRVDRTVAALTAVAGAVAGKFTDARWKASWKIVQKCVDADQADGAMVGGDLLVAAYKRLGKSDAKAQEALTHPHKLMPERMARILVGGTP